MNKGNEDRAKARALQRAKAAAAQRERVEKEMAKDAALIRAMEQKLQKSDTPSLQTKIVKDDNINNYALDSVVINMEGGLNTFEHLEDNSMFSPSKESDYHHSDSGSDSDSEVTQGSINEKYKIRNNVNNQVVEDNDNDNRNESDTCSNNNDEEEEEDDEDDDFFMNSVIKIQSAFRGHIGRSLVNVRKDRDVEKLQVLKAIKIQSIMRRIVKKRKDEKDKLRREERIEKDRIKREEAIERLRLERNQKIALKFDGKSPPKDNLKILKKHSAIHNQYKTNSPTNQTQKNELYNSPNQTKSLYHQTNSPTNQTQSHLTCLIDQRHIKPNQHDMELSWVDDFEDIMIAKEAVRKIISRADLYS